MIKLDKKTVPKEELTKDSKVNEFDREKHIRNEMRMYKKLFAVVPAERKDVLTRLCNEASFMSATLRELQIKIEEEGAIITMINGNGFEVMQESPAQVSYNRMIKNYTSTVKQILAELPKGEVNKAADGDDDLIAFLKEHRK